MRSELTGPIIYMTALILMLIALICAVLLGNEIGKKLLAKTADSRNYTLIEGII